MDQKKMYAEDVSLPEGYVLVNDQTDFSDGGGPIELYTSNDFLIMLVSSDRHGPAALALPLKLDRTDPLILRHDDPLLIGKELFRKSFFLDRSLKHRMSFGLLGSGGLQIWKPSLVWGLFGIQSIPPYKIFIFAEKTQPVSVKSSREGVRNISKFLYLSYNNESGTLVNLDDETTDGRCPSPLQGMKEDAKSNFYKLKGYIESCQFIFSKSLNLMKNRQQYDEIAEDDSGMDLKSPYFANRYLLSSVLNIDLPAFKRYLLSCIEGYYGEFEVPVGKKHGKLLFTLSSKKHIGHAGTRFHARGINRQGCTANTYETEACLVYDGYLASNIQIRGSVPCYWSQPGPNSPPDVIGDLAVNWPAFSRHIESLVKSYGKVTALNLLGSKSNNPEMALTNRYMDLLGIAATHLVLPVQYLGFDFHHEKVQNQNSLPRTMKKFRQLVEQDVLNYSYFMVNLQNMEISPSFHEMGSPSDDLSDTQSISKLNRTNKKSLPKDFPIAVQKGIIRMNCLDCMDRTNLAQKNVLSIILPMMLEKLIATSLQKDYPVGVARKKANILTRHLVYSPPFLQKYTQLWNENASVISQNYSGSRAHMTWSESNTNAVGSQSTGLLSSLFDLMQSGKRFVQMMWLDAEKQAGMDLFYGPKYLSPTESKYIGDSIVACDHPASIDSDILNQTEDLSWLSQFSPPSNPSNQPIFNSNSTSTTSSTSSTSKKLFIDYNIGILFKEHECSSQDLFLNVENMSMGGEVEEHVQVEERITFSDEEDEDEGEGEEALKQFNENAFIST